MCVAKLVCLLSEGRCADACLMVRIATILVVCAYLCRYGWDCPDGNEVGVRMC